MVDTRAIAWYAVPREGLPGRLLRERHTLGGAVLRWTLEKGLLAKGALRRYTTSGKTRKVSYSQGGWSETYDEELRFLDEAIERKQSGILCELGRMGNIDLFESMSLDLLGALAQLAGQGDTKSFGALHKGYQWGSLLQSVLLTNSFMAAKEFLNGGQWDRTHRRNYAMQWASEGGEHSMRALRRTRTSRFVPANCFEIACRRVSPRLLREFRLHWDCSQMRLDECVSIALKSGSHGVLRELREGFGATLGHAPAMWSDPAMMAEWRQWFPAGN